MREMTISPRGKHNNHNTREKHKRRNPSRIKQERKSEHTSTTQGRHESFAGQSIQYSAMHITNSSENMFAQIKKEVRSYDMTQWIVCIFQRSKDSSLVERSPKTECFHLIYKLINYKNPSSQSRCSCDSAPSQPLPLRQYIAILDFIDWCMADAAASSVFKTKT